MKDRRQFQVRNNECMLETAQNTFSLKRRTLSASWGVYCGPNHLIGQDRQKKRSHNVSPRCLRLTEYAEFFEMVLNS